MSKCSRCGINEKDGEVCNNCKNIECNKEVHRDGGVSIMLEKPKMPLSRITNYFRQVGICNKCGSSLVRKRWFYLFGEKKCLNNECYE